jgi:hypothetical protein
MREPIMTDPRCGFGAKTPSNAEIAASVEAIGHLHHMLKEITRSLALAKETARTLLDHSHAIPGGVPKEAAIAVAKLRLEVAHNETLTLDTLRCVVQTIPLPDVQLNMTLGATQSRGPHRNSNDREAISETTY